MNPPIESLLGTVDSKFSLVTLAARRARNINSYFNQLGDGLGHMIPPQVSSVSRKPLSIGFEEIAAAQDRVDRAPVEPEFDPEAEAQARPTPPARASSSPTPTTPDRRRAEPDAVA